MKTIKLLGIFTLAAMLFTSCYRETLVETVIIEQPIEPIPLTVNELLSSYELWYVDINATLGYGETPFLQKAFTISFLNGVLYANNNIVGIGNSGDGFGIDVANYDAYKMILDVNHDLDGFSTFDVFQINNSRIELYNPDNDTSYFLEGYQRDEFDYDFVFCDNIHYFLQEYEAWEKVYTSEFGALNAFDSENYLQFLAGGNDSTFRSSKDDIGMNPNYVFWDYIGLYGVGNITDNLYLKTLTLDYDYMGNAFFELTVINDKTIELFHPASETIYQFKGRGYIQYLKTTDGKKEQKNKTRKFKKDRIENPREKTRV
ncbi:nicotinic acid mononucleotide adenyltransferase [Algibacter mikhailovii]|uniref:nicotinic acid mononucleotide adenyltransferase n=1 Tax=Algibacter mikhailovii TaxID=425498 RepID=UPI00249430BA|nr:nicotinic acid mononucleotide adenyltransferase [Algibacter mikhailovii]